MRYCIVISVGYGVTLTILWNLLIVVALLSNMPIPLFQLVSFGIMVSLLATAVGMLINCAFETLGEAFSLKPSWAITLGWFAVSVVYTIVTLSSTLATNQDLLALAWKLATRATNTAPASNIFYIIGNVTLSLLGLK